MARLVHCIPNPVQDTCQTTLRFPQDMRSQLRDRAARNRRTFSAEVITLIEFALDTEQRLSVEPGA